MAIEGFDAGRRRLRCRTMFRLCVVVAGGLVMGSGCAPSHGPAVVANGDQRVGTGGVGTMRVVLLGTGTPNADPERFGPSVAIVVNDTAYLVDCGPGVVRRASAAYQRGIDALEVSRLSHVFITHLHTDHTLGLADLMFTPWVLGRASPLEAFGPVGLANMTDHLRQAYAEDVDMRINGLEPANEEGYKVNVHEIAEGVVYRDANVTVTAFAVQHGSWKHAFGYRFDTPGRSIVVSGDTRPSPSLMSAARGCDVLVHEVYSHAQFAGRSPEWQRYHASFHTSTRELAAIAEQVQPRLLILYHQLFWGASAEDLVREIGEGYSGRVVSGSDLDVY